MRIMTNKDLELLETVPHEYKQCLREKRQRECFAIVDRAAWYDSLSEDQKKEVQSWRLAWLNVTKTKIIPTKPSWIK